jgi:hypothetical protein
MLLNKQSQMRRKFRINSRNFLFVVIGFIIGSCSLTSTLPEERTVFVDDRAQVLLAPQVAQPKYLLNVPNQELKETLLSQLSATLNSNNFRTTTDVNAAQFRLEVQNITFTESSSPHTVSDAASPYNGVTFQLANCEVSYTLVLYNRSGGTEKLFETYVIDENREEKVKNNRTLGQVVTGSNKEKDEYRLKAFRDDVFKDVAEKGGRKGANRVCSRMARLIKKGKI